MGPIREVPPSALARVASSALRPISIHDFAGWSSSLLTLHPNLQCHVRQSKPQQQNNCCQGCSSAV